MHDSTAIALVGAYIVFIILALVISLLPMGIAGALMLKPVERGGVGFALGFFLGPIGLVIAWTMRANELLERAAYAERHRAALASMSTPVQQSGKPSWAPEEAPHRFR